MSEGVRVYINECGVTVPAGATAVEAVRVLLPEAATEVEQGTMRLLDSRGLPTDATQVVSGGAIFRIVPVRDRGVETSAS